MKTYVERFLAPLPPGVRKVRVKHLLGGTDAVFAIMNADNLYMVSGYSWEQFADYIDFTFYEPLPEGVRIIVIA